VLFTVHVPWGQVALRTVVPHVKLDANSAAMVVGVFGTTISPYLFFWQASEEVEDMQAAPAARPLVSDAKSAPPELRRIKWDTWTGMGYSNVSAFFIILATAVTLHVAGVGLIGVPVLAGSAAYAMAEAMSWREGLEQRVEDARGFYAVIAISVLAGLLIQYSPISPMRALFWSAVINGVVAVPLMVVIILLSSRKSVMGDYTASRTLLTLAWIATAVMGGAAVMMVL
jgi:Mn2+/Fe2+ NRAMP family transporter